MPEPKDILEELIELSRTMSSAKLHSSKQIVDRAFSEIARLRNSLREADGKLQLLQAEFEALKNAQVVQEALLAPEPAPHDSSSELSPAPDDEPAEPLLAADETDMPYAIKRKVDGRYLETLQFSQWDDEDHVVGNPGYPGVWKQDVAQVFVDALNSLGADVELELVSKPIRGV